MKMTLDRRRKILSHVEVFWVWPNWAKKKERAELAKKCFVEVNLDSRLVTLTTLGEMEIEK